MAGHNGAGAILLFGAVLNFGVRGV